jgi:hypothetical protein
LPQKCSAAAIKKFLPLCAGRNGVFCHPVWASELKSDRFYLILRQLTRKLFMPILRTASTCIFLALLATGCNKASEPPQPTDSPIDLPQAAMPQSDAAIKATPLDQAAATSNSTNQSQANPAELSKSQESNAMPMPGQANDHSLPNPLNNSSK